MFNRVTPKYMVNDFDSNLRSRSEEIQRTQNRLSSGMRVNRPSEDPVATMLYMDYDSRLNEISTYRTLIDGAQSRLKTTDGALDGATNVLQRIRELAVQGANSTYTKDDRQKMAVEVDQLMRELLSVANTHYKGEPLFGGTMVDTMPFKAQYKTDPATGIEFMTDVRYIGNNQSQVAEVNRAERVVTAQPGNQVFWADNMMIYSTLNVAGYTAPADSVIVVDGIDVPIRQGDNLEVITEKINRSGAAVIAGIETQNGQSYFTIQSTSPHQITLMDNNGGTVLKDLGIIDPGMQSPNNYSPAAKVFTNSIFDVLSQFRKDLLDDNVLHIGGSALAGIDNSLSNILKYRANLGSVSSRLEFVTERLAADELYITEARDNAVGTDIPRTMTAMKLLEFSHDVALNIGSRILPRTLLDFMR